MNYGYIRVSTDTQTTRNQEFEITRFCKAQGLSIDCWIEETISGQQAYNKRAFGDLLRRVGDGDLIICTELSRLGRSLFMIMEILNICHQRKERVELVCGTNPAFYLWQGDGPLVPVGLRLQQPSVPVQDAAGSKYYKPLTPNPGQCVSEALIADVFQCRLVAEQQDALL